MKEVPIHVFIFQLRLLKVVVCILWTVKLCILFFYIIGLFLGFVVSDLPFLFWGYSILPDLN
jgi:hypothetical protein